MNCRNLLLVAVVLASGISSEVHAAARQFLWVTNAYGNDLHVIDVTTHRVIKRVEVGTADLATIYKVFQGECYRFSTFLSGFLNQPFGF